MEVRMERQHEFPKYRKCSVGQRSAPGYTQHTDRDGVTIMLIDNSI